MELLDIKMILEKNGAYETNDINAVYYVLEDGSKWSFGYDKYCGRIEDHRVIFGCFENIEYNDFKSLIEKTGMLGYCPETNIAWSINRSLITEEQMNFIYEVGAEIEYDI